MYRRVRKSSKESLVSNVLEAAGNNSHVKTLVSWVGKDKSHMSTPIQLRSFPKQEALRTTCTLVIVLRSGLEIATAVVPVTSMFGLKVICASASIQSGVPCQLVRTVLHQSQPVFTWPTPYLPHQTHYLSSLLNIPIATSTSLDSQNHTISLIE